MDTSIVWVSAMRWKECQPIFKCHCLFLFWIPALLCATDLNWVNITCAAPVGPSVCVHVGLCMCGNMHVDASNHDHVCLIMQWYEHLGLGCPQFALSEFPTVAKQLQISFFPARNYCLSSPIRSEHALSANCLSLLLCSLLEEAAGGSVKKRSCLTACHANFACVCVHQKCVCIQRCLAVVHCSAAVRRGLPCWSFQINRHW